MARKDRYAGLVDLLERVVAACTAEVVAAVNDLLQVMGPRPFGYAHTDMQGQLDQWLTIRDDPAFWVGWFAQNVPLVGAETAASFAVREAHRLNDRLAELGGWSGDPDDLERAVADGALAVRSRALMQQLGVAQQAADKADAIASLPPIRVLPPLSVPDEMQLLQGVA